jgi:hypothetical protein
MNSLYATVTNCTNIINVHISMSHNQPTTNATVECISSSLTIGDYATINLGYSTNHRLLFSGYVKQIDRRTPDGIYVITLADEMIRAVDYFIVPTNPDYAISYSNITAEDLAENVMELAGLWDFVYDVTYFTFAINNPVEVKLISSYDFVRMIGDIITWSVWCDTGGTIHFENRKPYPMTGTTGQPGDVADVPISYQLTDANILDYNYSVTERNLRNRVVVWGSEGIVAEASSPSDYLPEGFYKSVLLSAPDLIDSQSIAEDTADYNLDLLNRLTETYQVTVIGNPLLEARKVITSNVTLFSPTVTANLYVFACEHIWDKSGYIVRLDLRE